MEQGVNDLRTIKRIIQDLRFQLYLYEQRSSEANLRGVGNIAGLLAERIQERRGTKAPAKGG